MKVLWMIIKWAVKLAPIYQIVAALITDYLKKLRDNKKWMYTLELGRKISRYVGEQLILFADSLDDYVIEAGELEGITEAAKSAVADVNKTRLEIIQKYAEGESAREEKARLAQIELDKAAELKAARDAAKALSEAAA